ncbi:MAG: nitrogen fixation protein FixH [Nitrosomonadales bacterium]|nr:MAG: nitrogen fixation protein FixH [Nitrosomonadales bacterium]
MTFTETLFGGLLAVVFLFLAARRAGLSNYWSAVLSGALPFLAYLGYSAKAAPGGDVIAVHFSVFVATAAVLGVFSSMRRKKEKMHWAPKLIIAFFASLVLLMAAFLAISMHGLPDWLARRILPNAAHTTLHTGFPGVTPHDRNKLYEPHQQRMAAQRNLGWQVKLEGLDSLHRGVAGDITLRVTDAKGVPVNADSATLGLWRMANSQDDRKFELTPISPGVFHAGITLPDAGRWIAEMYVQRGQDSYLAQQPLVVAE